ncbi:MAG: glycosyltransferase family 4 protein [bacterium]
MRILQVNKFNYQKGGSEKYFLELSEALEQQGHEVAKFSMQNPLNFKDKNEKYFVSQVDFNQGSFYDKIRAAFRLFWSFEAAKKFDQLLLDFQPEVVHIHNIYHQLSPSILLKAKKRRIPVIMHLHDYKLLCPNMKMYNQGGVCEQCKGGRYFNCTLKRCLKESYLKSLLASLEMYFHHAILKIYERVITTYIAPSMFVLKKAIEWGVEQDKIVHLPYFIKTVDYEPQYEPGDYLLFYGRLVKEKGVKTLLLAYQTLGHKVPNLKIVGAGPEYKELEQQIKELGLASKVVMTGPKYGETLKQLVANCYAIIVPSEWYEVTGIVNMEASILGKPVLAANIGGIGEVVKNKETGLLFKSGSVKSLSEALGLLLSDEALARQFGEAGHEYIVKNYNKKNHLSKIVSVYKNAIQAEKNK